MLPMSPTRRPIVPPSSRSFRMRTSSSFRTRLHTHRQIDEAQDQGGPAFQDDWEKAEREQARTMPPGPERNVAMKQAGILRNAAEYRCLKHWRYQQTARQLLTKSVACSHRSVGAPSVIKNTHGRKVSMA